MQTQVKFYHQYAFSRIGAKLWNEIPTNLRNLPRHQFKKKIRSLLFEVLESDDSYYDLDGIISKVKKRTS